jgi:hypothetical protein
LACGPTKKLVVPTVHPVGPIERLVRASGFSRNYQSAFIGVGTVVQRPLPKSKYIVSPFGFLSPSFFPSAITAGAYLHWMTKLSRPRGVHLSNLEYLRALEILNREFAPYIVGGFTELEEVLKFVDWDKSPGWDYVNRGCATKRDAWDKFSEEIIEKALALVRGEYVESTFIATVKDELLPAGKNPRIFLPAPFHHQIACAMLFKKACDSFNTTCHRHSSAIGANIFGRGLERLLRSLDCLPFAYDADQTGCDTSWKDAEPERDFMKTGLAPQYHAGVDMVFNLAMCPKVIVGDRILQLELNPSGWYLTTIMNTLMTHRTIAAAYLDLAPVPETITSMREHLKQINGGDDLGYSTDRPWFDIVSLSHEVARRGMFLESDVLIPRRALALTFYSQTLRLRAIGDGTRSIYVACGRLGKILSAFSYLKTSEGKVNWLRNASRVVGLMFNLWPYREEYNIMFPYLYHLVHHFFLESGEILTPEWSGVFRSIPTDSMMMSLRNGHAYETGLVFSPHRDFSSLIHVKRSLQSALKSDLIVSNCLDTSLIDSPDFDPVTMTDATTRKIDNILDKLEKKSSLTADGRAWLVAAADPFHDTDIVLAGYPDVNTSATVVQLIKKQLQLAAPAALTTGTWDVSIVLFPTMGTVSYGFANTVTASGVIAGGTASTGFFVGGLVANSAASAGSPVLWPNATSTQPTGTNFQSVSLDISEFIKGNVRIIGLGFEVVNTTSALNKQGQVTAWRMPTNPSPTSIYNTQAPLTALLQYTGVQSRLPPGTIADAQLLFGSRSWAAEEGSYTVCRQNDEDNPLRSPDFVPDWYLPADLSSKTGGVIYTLNEPGSSASSQKLFADIRAPYDLSGVHFTGLSLPTTLTVNVRWLIERCPGPNEQDLVVLATPSAAYDPLALELYTHCMNKMPPGVPVAENGLGEWFRGALSTAEKWAPKIGEFVGNVVPGASAFGKAIGVGSGMALKLVPQQQQQQKAPVMSQALQNEIKNAKLPLQGSASTTNSKKFAPRATGLRMSKNRRPLLLRRR